MNRKIVLRKSFILLKRVLAMAMIFAMGAGRLMADELASGDFLNLVIHPQALAVGEAATAGAQGSGLVGVNPAAVVGVTEREFSFAQGFLTEESEASQFAFGLNFKKHFMAISYAQLDHGTLIQRNESGVQEGDFAPKDSSLAFTYGKRFRVSSWGVTVKQVKSRIIKEADTVSLDVGTQYKLGKEVSLGLAYLNALGKLEYDKESASLPKTLRSGLSWHPHEPFHITLDFVHPLYDDSYMAFGGDYRFQMSKVLEMSLRAGYNTKTPDLDGFSGINGGVGLTYHRLTLDYAVDPFGDFGLTHYMGLDYAW